MAPNVSPLICQSTSGRSHLGLYGARVGDERRQGPAPGLGVDLGDLTMFVAAVEFKMPITRKPPTALYTCRHGIIGMKARYEK